ncbi:MAG: response regulator [Rhodospirillaceae bacterium]
MAVVAAAAALARGSRKGILSKILYVFIRIVSAGGRRIDVSVDSLPRRHPAIITNPTTPVIAIVDDDSALRDALAILLNAEKMTVVSFSSGEDFLETAPVNDIGCVVLDIHLSGMDGMEVFRAIRKVRDSLPVIIMTGHGSVPLAVEALKAGALDFIQKPFDPDRLLAGIRQATNLEAAEREAKIRVTTFQEQLAKLTAREREVMDLMVAGYTSKAIGVALSISSRTVEIYRSHVMSKMKADSLVELIRRNIMFQGAAGSKTSSGAA